MLVSLEYPETRMLGKNFIYAAELPELLNEDEKNNLLKPIISLIDGSVFGYEPIHEEILTQWGIRRKPKVYELSATSRIQDLLFIYQQLNDDTCLRYVKLNRQLTYNIHKDHFKQSFVQLLQNLSRKTNIKMIADQLDDDDDLAELLKIGIDYGQFKSFDSLVVKKICHESHQKHCRCSQPTLSMPIGELAQYVPGVSPLTTGYCLADYFHEHSEWRGVPIIDQEEPVGLVMKDNFFSNLATQYGMAVYMNRPIELIMDRQPMIVDYSMSLEKVSQIAVNRPNDQLYDYILVTKEQKYCGMITVKDLLEKTTQLEVNRAKHANPLTGLPGNVLIEQVLQEVILAEQLFAVLYFDLDNFKAYNDLYGFEHGDVILRKTAQLIQCHVEQSGIKSFVGHIGGDDFVVVLRDISINEIETLCKEILKSFCEATSEWYKPSDLAQKYIIAKNRHGQEERFPLITLSIAVVTNRERTYCSPYDLAAIAGIVKKQCKLSWTNCYSIDGKAIDS